MQPSLEVAAVVAIWVEVLLYGIYTCLFLESLYIMLKKRSTSARSAKVFLCSTVLMYLVATAHIIVNLFRLLRGFVIHVDPMGTTDYIWDFTRWENIAHNALLISMTWLGDALVIYRCFIVWNNNYYVIALPLILLILSIAINIMLLWWFSHKTVVLTTSVAVAWMNTIYPLAFVQNVLTTGMISLKIWRQHRASSASGVIDSASRLSLINIMRIIIESAMIYTIQLVVLVILYPLHHTAQFIVQSAVVPSIGIVFVLIAVRVHFIKSRTLFAGTVMAAMPTWLEDDDSSSQRSLPDSSTRTAATYQMEDKFQSANFPRSPLASSSTNVGQETSNA